MSKKDISKILTTGSAKQRALLLAENIARGKYSQERLLTDHEINQLSESFKKPNEIQPVSYTHLTLPTSDLV